MRIQSAAQQDSPIAVTPPIQPLMPWRVVAVKALPDFRLHIRFVDGTEGTVDLSALIYSPSAGIFASLADSALFAQVSIEHGAVTWQGKIDLAPDAMCAEIKKTGTWVLQASP
jgi:CubicO group peptidase (beta-lactamase class C family)